MSLKKLAWQIEFTHNDNNELQPKIRGGYHKLKCGDDKKKSAPKKQNNKMRTRTTCFKVDKSKGSKCNMLIIEDTSFSDGNSSKDDSSTKTNGSSGSTICVKLIEEDVCTDGEERSEKKSKNKPKQTLLCAKKASKSNDGKEKEKKKGSSKDSKKQKPSEDPKKNLQRRKAMDESDEDLDDPNERHSASECQEIPVTILKKKKRSSSKNGKKSKVSKKNSESETKSKSSVRSKKSNTKSKAKDKESCELCKLHKVPKLKLPCCQEQKKPRKSRSRDTSAASQKKSKSDVKNRRTKPKSVPRRKRSQASLCTSMKTDSSQSKERHKSETSIDTKCKKCKPEAKDDCERKEKKENTNSKKKKTNECKMCKQKKDSKTDTKTKSKSKSTSSKKKEDSCHVVSSASTINTHSEGEKESQSTEIPVGSCENTSDEDGNLGTQLGGGREVSRDGTQDKNQENVAWDKQNLRSLQQCNGYSDISTPNKEQDLQPNMPNLDAAFWSSPFTQNEPPFPLNLCGRCKALNITSNEYPGYVPGGDAMSPDELAQLFVELASIGEDDIFNPPVNTDTLSKRREDEIDLASMGEADWNYNGDFAFDLKFCAVDDEPPCSV